MIILSNNTSFVIVFAAVLVPVLLALVLLALVPVLLALVPVLLALVTVPVLLALVLLKSVIIFILGFCSLEEGKCLFFCVVPFQLR